VDVGIDLDKTHWDVAVVVEGYEHKVSHQPPRVEPLVKYLRRNFPGARYRCVYEAGCFGFWIHDALRERGMECIVVNPADVPTKDKERRRRNDRVDARKLARGLHSGELTAVYVPTRRALEARVLVRTRWRVVQKLTRCKNQIKSMLTFYGIAIPDALRTAGWSQRFLDWLEQVPFETASGRQALDVLLLELQYLTALRAQVTEHMRALARDERYSTDVENLMTIPGIGLLTAMTLVTEIIDVHRFKGLDQLASYAGLVPGEDSSGDRERVTGITSRRNPRLRHVLIEASWVAARKDPALLQKLTQLTRHMSKTQAIIRIARKLLNRIRYVLKNRAPYELCVVQ